MKKPYKKLFICFLLLSILVKGVSAQQNHFVYVQTENKQPFYVKLDKKILSSSATGYIIIPKLQDGNYEFTIGFPKNEWPEQKVTCNVNQRDLGYLLKNFGEKGWGLFNLQTMDVIMANTRPAESKTVVEETKKDVFSNTLSAVVNDPSIAKKTEEKPIVKEEPKPAEAVAKKEESVQPAVKEETKAPAPVVKKEIMAPPVNQVTRLLRNNIDEGTELVYIDITDSKPDTVRVFIPKENAPVTPQVEKKAEEKLVELPQQAAPKNDIVKKEAVKTDSIPQQVVKKAEVVKAETPVTEVKKEPAEKEATKKTEADKDEAKKSDTKFIDMELPNPNAKKDTVVKPVQQALPVEKHAVVQDPAPKPKEIPAKPVIGNSDCKNFATEDDFLKLRKKMAAEDNDDEMVAVAKKVLRSKCFTTEQVKNLSVLFLKDEGKYKFFDAAYPFTSDSYNFSTLEAQLTDNYFITRFRAMIRH